MSWYHFMDAIGWVSAAISLLAYYLVSTRQLDGASVKYQALNIASAVGLFFNAVHNGAYPSGTVNFVWIGIALFSIAKYRGGRVGV